jgi:hypothetical protein
VQRYGQPQLPRQPNTRVVHNKHSTEFGRDRSTATLGCECSYRRAEKEEEEEEEEEEAEEEEG